MKRAMSTRYGRVVGWLRTLTTLAAGRVSAEIVERRVARVRDELRLIKHVVRIA